MCRVVSEDIVDAIRDGIITGDFKPRERLLEKELAERFSVSRTPVREALKTLEHLGLVKNEKYKGASVADIDTEEIKEIYEIRDILETLAAKKATKNLSDSKINELKECIKAMELERNEGDPEKFSEYDIMFHKIVNSCCGNKLLEKIIEDLLDKTFYFRRVSWLNPKNMDRALNDHKLLLNAFRNGDIDEVEKIYHNHIRLLIAA